MTMVIDSVCGMQVDTDSAQWTTERDRETHYFCSKGCMLEFRDDPEKYLDPGYKPEGMEGATGSHS
jgi:YHS domain-containing protein